jgi:molybdopterin converting factor small subunit
MVKVRLYGSFRAIVGRDEVLVDSGSLGALLDTLKRSYPDIAKFIDSEGFVVLVNEKPVPIANLGLRLDSKDVVDLLPVVSGGGG